jgi:hypothetical protein
MNIYVLMGGLSLETSRIVPGLRPEEVPVALRFRHTQLVQGGGSLRLLDLEGNLILELRGREIGEAKRAGFLDARDNHFSMYAYARLKGEFEPFRDAEVKVRRLETERIPVVRERLDPEDNEFLSSIGIRW